MQKSQTGFTFILFHNHIDKQLEHKKHTLLMSSDALQELNGKSWFIKLSVQRSRPQHFEQPCTCGCMPTCTKEWRYNDLFK